jgi:hypothetical protein
MLPGTRFTMGVVRARVIFPYKVGHFFSSAGPLRADLVKFTVASRDVPRGARPLGAPLRCRRVPAPPPGCSAACSRAATGRYAGLDVGGRYICSERADAWASGWVQIYIYLLRSSTLPTTREPDLVAPFLLASRSHAITAHPTRIYYIHGHAWHSGASWLVRGRRGVPAHAHALALAPARACGGRLARRSANRRE